MLTGLGSHSTTGYVVFLGSTPITWVSKKQSTVSHSSTEAEYCSLASTTAELYWLRMYDILYLIKIYYYLSFNLIYR